MICDWWISIRFVCFCVSRFVALFLKSTVSFTLVLSLFNFFILKRGKFRFQRWNCYYRACKSGGNTDKKGFKRTGTFPLTFTFADKHSRCYGNGLIDVAEKFEFGACSIWIVEDVERGSFLFPTLISRKIEGDSVRSVSINRHHTQAEKYGGRGKNLLCVTEQQR